jgi:predicted Zn finger-like uncharacterized protein
MIIECQSCHARFRLDEAKIKGRGARVRCRKCGDSIVVLKESAPAPPTPTGDGTFDLGSAVRESVGEAPVSPASAGNLIPFPAPTRPAEPVSTGSAPHGPEAEEPVKDEVDMAFERALFAGAEGSSLSAGQPEAPVSGPAAGVPPVEEVPAGEEPPKPDLGSLILDFGPEEKLDLPPAGEPEPSFGAPPVADPSGEFRAKGGFLISDSDTLDFLQEKQRDAVPEVPPAPDEPPDSPTPEENILEGNAPPPVPGKEGSFDLRSAVRESVGEAPEPARELPRRSLAIPAVAAVVAILLAAGAYLGLTPSGRKTLEGAIPGVAALWGGKPAASPGPKYDLRNVIGYFESGAVSPRILVIRGQVANLTAVEKSGIRIRASLLDNTDAVLVERAVYAGNVLSGEAIRKGDRDTVSKTLENRFGEGLANLNVAPGKAIPFMVVFYDAPANMDSYRVEAKDGE